MIEASAGDDSITNDEALALEYLAWDIAFGVINRLGPEPWVERFEPLLEEITAGPDVRYEPVYSDSGRKGEFVKIENIIYYILSEKERSIAYNFSDLHVIYCIRTLFSFE